MISILPSHYHRLAQNMEQKRLILNSMLVHAVHSKRWSSNWVYLLTSVDCNNNNKMILIARTILRTININSLYNSQLKIFVTRII